MAAVQEAKRPLSLATVAFRCVLPESDEEGSAKAKKRPCSEPLFYPCVLAHDCAYHKRPESIEEEGAGDADAEYLPDVFSYHQVYNLGGHSIKAYPEASTLIARLVTLCGLDPEVTTREELG